MAAISTATQRISETDVVSHGSSIASVVETKEEAHSDVDLVTQQAMMVSA